MEPSPTTTVEPTSAVEVVELISEVLEAELFCKREEGLLFFCWIQKTSDIGDSYEVGEPRRHSCGISSVFVGTVEWVPVCRSLVVGLPTSQMKRYQSTRGWLVCGGNGGVLIIEEGDVCRSRSVA